MLNNINVNTANFIQFSLSQGHNINEVLATPHSVGGKLGISLNSDQINEIEQIKSLPQREQLKNLSPKAKHFIKEVLKDGRYVLDWKNSPYEVSEKLSLSVEPDVITELDEIDLSDFLDPNINPVAGIKIAIISVAIAVVLGSADIGDDTLPVLDLSNVTKL
jgi:hypothetical protein